ncbi:hypothetical protein H7849_03700 [Alloacidobacterium dinghuense]|uniref:Uncharacterized protein n=1 Tax=Alloacidobacterium dinghuense TaxID=2763107 RepID=A0A7G8BKM4_9BACT|nr:hypothetical protein [Alloacidobacterium dinghuense]QNI33094.1 hypothetical protein H7849_03700 [Alloacidobacterium dinghuense]
MYNECRHIFTSGKKCQSPALKAEDFCYFHHKTRRRPSPQNQPYEPYTEPKETTLNLSPLEDADAIQLAISDVVLALAANRIDSRRARILIYGLQVASQNNRHRAAMAVKEAAIEQTVREAHEHADGTLIGPEKQSPEPEEAAARKRPPSLGEILLRQAEELSARKAEEARLNAEAEQAAQSKPVLLPKIEAVAETQRQPINESVGCPMSRRDMGSLYEGIHSNQRHRSYEPLRQHTRSRHAGKKRSTRRAHAPAHAR